MRSLLSSSLPAKQSAKRTVTGEEGSEKEQTGGGLLTEALSDRFEGDEGVAEGDAQVAEDSRVGQIALQAADWQLQKPQARKKSYSVFCFFWVF